jgi:hypothetical protein
MNHTDANQLKMEIQKGTHDKVIYRQTDRQHTQKNIDKQTDRQTDI